MFAIRSAENYHNLIEEFKQKKRDHEESIEIFKNKIHFSNTVNQLADYIALGKIKPSQIKTKTYFEMIYSWFL